MSNHTSIDNYGDITNWGYLKRKVDAEDSGLYNRRYKTDQNQKKTEVSAVVRLPMVVYDFNGGSYTLSAYNKGIMPINGFDFPNLQVKTVFEYKSKMEAYATFYISTGNRMFGAKAYVVGADTDTCLFKRKENSAIEMEYKPNNKDYLYTDSRGITQIRVSGDFVFSYIKLKIWIKDIDTSKCLLPISSHLQITLKKGTNFDLAEGIKFLSGSSLTVENGATRNVNSKCAFYDGANFVRNGKLNIKNYFGGRIQVSEKTAEINTAFDGFINNVSSDDMDGSKNVKTSTFNAVIDQLQKNYYFDDSVEEYKAANKVIEQNKLLKNHLYTSLNDDNNQVVWYCSDDDKHGIRIIMDPENMFADDSLIQNPNSNDSLFFLFSSENRIELDPLTCTDETRVFNGFYYDSVFSDPLDYDSSSNKYFLDLTKIKKNNLVDQYGCLSVYSKWNTRNYSVKYNGILDFSSGAYTKPSLSSGTIQVHDVNDFFVKKEDIRKEDGFYIEYNDPLNQTFKIYKYERRFSAFLNDSLSPLTGFENVTYEDLKKVTNIILDPGDELLIKEATNPSIYNCELSVSSPVAADTNLENGQSYKFSAIVKVNEDANASIPGVMFSYSWTADDGGGTISIDNDDSSSKDISIKNSGRNDSKNWKSGSLTLKLSTTVNEVTKEVAMANSVSFKTQTCVTNDTLIAMADGTYKKAGELKFGDEVLVFDHYKGRVSSGIIAFNDRDKVDDYKIIHLLFSNGKEIKIATEHGFFDIELNKYIYITENNYQNYIGHKFLSVKDKSVGIVKLMKAFEKIERVGVCSPGTAKHFNIVTEDILSIPGGIKGLFNIFELDGHLKFDEDKMKADIQKYGLVSYEEYEGMISKEAYDAFGAAYRKVAIGKGLIDKERIQYLINRYAKFVK